ncbi:TPA: SGNH/GDSL hydrolase family protein, partial [Klebsiella pneumoniae]
MAEVPLPTPTDNPVPSTDIRDTVYAGAMLDKVVTSTEPTYIDRLGGEHYTVDGIKAEGDKVVEETRQNLIPLSRQYMTLAAAQADIANIPEGSTTYYRSPDDSSLAVEVINNAGTLQPTGRKMPSQDAVSAVDEKINETNTRTEGLKTSEKSVNPFEIIDNAGRTPFFINDIGIVNAPGGISTKSIDGLDNISVENMSTSDLTAKVVTTEKINAESDNGYPFPVIDLNGRVLWYWDAVTGRPVCLGEPLTNHRGPLPGDIFAIGDSITAYGVAWSGANASGTSYAPCINDQSWHGWASLFTNGRIQLAGISATGGYTVTQVKNVHLPNAIAADPTFCVVMCGRNDIVQGINIDTVTIPAF